MALKQQKKALNGVDPTNETKCNNQKQPKTHLLCISKVVGRGHKGKGDFFFSTLDTASIYLLAYISTIIQRKYHTHTHSLSTKKKYAAIQ